MRVFLLFLYSICFLCSICLVSQPALAQSKKELAAQNVQLSQRLTILENRMLTGDPAAERLMQRMDAQETAQRSLTGEVERLRYERETLQEEVRALAGTIAELRTVADDMRRHLQAIDIVSQDVPAPNTSIVYGSGTMGGGTYGNGSSIPGPPAIMGTSPTQIAPVTGNDISKLADIGRDQMAEGRFSEAQVSFKQYLELNPQAEDLGDVYYWLGETHYVLGGYADAADAYIASMRAAPKGSFAPEAMVRLAATARGLGQKEMACQTLVSFPTQYPNAPRSVRAKATLEAQRSGC